MSSITKYELKSGKTLYRVQYTVGHDPLSGKPIRKSKRGFKKKTEAKLWLSKQIVEIDEHGYSEDKDVKYSKVYDYFLDSYKNTVRESTLNRVKGLFKYHILPVFGKKSIKDITLPMCQTAVNNWSKELVDFKKVANYAGLVFKTAMKLEIIYSNPMVLTTFPKDDPNRHKAENDKFWDKEELGTFLGQVNKYYSGKNKKAIALFRLMAFTGARKGELLALRINDFDYQECSIIINKTVTRAVDNKQVVGLPKTSKGNRKLYLDQDTANVLNDWIKELKLELSVLGFNHIRDNQLIFPNRDNRLLSLMRPNKWMDAVIDSYNKGKKGGSKLKRITPHGIRHTWATIALETNKLTVKQIQEQLGDSDASIVLNTYSHVTKQASKNTIQEFSQYTGF